MKKRCIETTVANKALEENQRPKIVNNLGGRFLKSSFTVNDYFSRDVSSTPSSSSSTAAGAAATGATGAAAAGRAAVEPMLAPALEPLIRVYQKIARKRTDWRCKPEALDHSFLTPADAMSTLRAAPLQHRFAPDLHTSFSAATDAGATEEGGVREVGEEAAERKTVASNATTEKKKKRVLVPVTGGLSSLACLWWAMQQDDVEICLCYVFGIEGTNVAGEMRALMELLRYGRDQRGEPFVDNPANAAGEAIYNPHSRFKILPIPSQPYHLPASANVDALTPNFVGPIHENLYDQQQQQQQQWPNEASSVKYHPMTYLLLYRVLLDAAQAFECESIVFGVYGDARELIEGAHRTFTRLVVPHSVVFPFPHRTDALYALQEGALRSSQVWQSIRKQKTPVDEDDEEEDDKGERKRGSSNKATSSSSASSLAKGRRSSLAAASKAMLPNNTNKFVWTTPGPTLMADVAQYAWTCRSATLSDETTMREAVAIATRERLAQKEQKDSKQAESAAEEGDEQKKKRKRATNATAPLTRRFLEVFYRRRKCHGLNLFNWCGNCIDCYMWRSVSWMWHRAASTSASSGELMSMFGEYTALLTEGYWRYLSERRLLQRVGETDLTLLQHMFEPERVKSKQKKSKGKQIKTEGEEEEEVEYVGVGEDGDDGDDDEEKEEEEEDDGEEKNSDDDEEQVADGADDEEKEEGADEEEEKEDEEDEVEEDEDADADAGDDGEIEEDENDQDNEFYDDLDEDQFHDDDDGGAGGGGGGDDDGSGGDMDYD